MRLPPGAQSFPRGSLVGVLLACVSLLGFGACADFERPNTPMPRLPMHRLEGGELSSQAFLGRPWVLVLWVPG